MLDSATLAINKLDNGDIFTLAGIKAPTPVVVAGMEVLCHLFQQKPLKVPENQKLPNDA